MFLQQAFLQDVLNTKHKKEIIFKSLELILQAQISICVLCNHIFNYSIFQKKIKNLMENYELTTNVTNMINKWLPETAEVQKRISSYKV